MTIYEFLGKIYLSKKIKHFFWKKIYDRVANAYEMFDWNFMNFGFDYYNQEPYLEEKDEKYRYFIQLYHHTVEKLDVRGKTVLDIGCGRGGGTSYVARYLHPTKITGVDYSKNNIKWCNRNHNENNLEFIEGDASNLPADNNSYDIVMNVESSHCYPSIPQFFSEVKRVLKPGGLFAWTDICPEQVFGKKDVYARVYEEAFYNCFGDTVVHSCEITDNVLSALDKEVVNNMKNEIINQYAPFYLKGIMREFAAIKNTHIYNSLKYGESKYHFKILTKKI